MRLLSRICGAFLSCTQALGEFIGPQGPISDAKLDLKITKAATRPDMQHNSMGPSKFTRHWTEFSHSNIQCLCTETWLPRCELFNSIFSASHLKGNLDVHLLQSMKKTIILFHTNRAWSLFHVWIGAHVCLRLFMVSNKGCHDTALLHALIIPYINW